MIIINRPSKMISNPSRYIGVVDLLRRNEGVIEIIVSNLMYSSISLQCRKYEGRVCQWVVMEYIGLSQYKLDLIQKDSKIYRDGCNCFRYDSTNNIKQKFPKTTLNKNIKQNKINQQSLQRLFIGISLKYIGINNIDVTTYPHGTDSILLQTIQIQGTSYQHNIEQRAHRVAAVQIFIQ